jgi:hypothetical protein
MDVGIVSLELHKEFGCSWELAIGLADIWDTVDDELAESVIADEIEEACGEFVEEGSFVVFNEVAPWFTCKSEYKIECKTDAPSACHKGEQGFCLP